MCRSCASALISRRRFFPRSIACAFSPGPLPARSRSAPRFASSSARAIATMRRVRASTGRSSAASPPPASPKARRRRRRGMSAAGTNVLWKTADPRSRTVEPRRLGGPALRQHRRSAGTRARAVRPGLYGDIKSVTDDTPHEWRVYALNKKTGAIVWQQTAHTGVPKIKRHTKNSPRQFHAGDRRRAPRRVLRIGRGLRVRPEGQAALAEGSRRARCRLLHGAGGAMGDGQLPRHSRRRRDHPGGRAEGIVSRGVRREERPRAVARRRAPTCRRGARPRCTS